MDRILFSSKQHDWETPWHFFTKLDAEFHFTLDPCCSIQTAKCKYFFTEKENGLLQSWKGHRVFCNPPYGRVIGYWVKKCFDESQAPHTKVVMLIPARTDTRWFHHYIYHKTQEIRFLKGRLRFGNSIHAAPFPSMVVVF